MEKQFLKLTCHHQGRREGTILINPSHIACVEEYNGLSKMGSHIIMAGVQLDGGWEYPNLICAETVGEIEYQLNQLCIK